MLSAFKSKPSSSTSNANRPWCLERRKRGATLPMVISSAGAPSDLSPWLGVWTGDGTSPPFKIEQEKFEEVLTAQGFPWAFVKLVQQFGTVRIMELDEQGRFHFASKMLTGETSL